MPAKTKKRTSANGYTLLELLVVVSIVGLLSSSIMVVVRNSRLKAQLATLVEDARQIITQIQIATGDLGLPIKEIVNSQESATLYSNGTIRTKDNLYAQQYYLPEWQALGFNSIPKDPWGGPFIIQEWEHRDTPSNCSRHDNVYSAGPDGLFQSIYYSPAAPVGVIVGGQNIISGGYDDDYVFALPFAVCPGF
jgi:prepilin-type N-terminal cleavage/methylation domain-containing protein